MHTYISSSCLPTSTIHASCFNWTEALRKTSRFVPTSIRFRISGSCLSTCLRISVHQYAYHCNLLSCPVVCGLAPFNSHSYLNTVLSYSCHPSPYLSLREEPYISRLSRFWHQKVLSSLTTYIWEAPALHNHHVYRSSSPSHSPPHRLRVVYATRRPGATMASVAWKHLWMNIYAELTTNRVPSDSLLWLCESIPDPRVLLSAVLVTVATSACPRALDPRVIAPPDADAGATWKAGSWGVLERP